MSSARSVPGISTSESDAGELVAVLPLHERARLHHHPGQLLHEERHAVGPARDLVHHAPRGAPCCRPAPSASPRSPRAPAARAGAGASPSSRTTGRTRGGRSGGRTWGRRGPRGRAGRAARCVVGSAQCKSSTTRRRARFSAMARSSETTALSVSVFRRWGETSSGAYGAAKGREKSGRNSGIASARSSRGAELRLECAHLPAARPPGRGRARGRGGRRWGRGRCSACPASSGPRGRRGLVARRSRSSRDEPALADARARR